MGRKGKMSSIRWKSNKRYHLYDKDGNLKLDELNGRDRKKYIESHSREVKRIEEEKRPPKVRRKIDGVWVMIENRGDNP
jgi:5'(3')-deoxyribonucleotidase